MNVSYLLKILVLAFVVLIENVNLASTDVTQKVSEPVASNPIKASCDWYSEVKRTNTWFERDQEYRAKVGQLFEAAAARGSHPNIDEVKNIEQSMIAVDRVLQSELDDLVDRCGWPTTSEYGQSAPTFAAMIVQHADIEYELKYFPLIQAAVKSKEIDPHILAQLEDRILFRQGKKQIYGTQITSKDKSSNELILWPVEDEEHLNQRRAEVGLQPVDICSYLRLFTPHVAYVKCDQSDH